MNIDRSTGNHTESDKSTIPKEKEDIAGVLVLPILEEMDFDFFDKTSMYWLDSQGTRLLSPDLTSDAISYCSTDEHRKKHYNYTGTDEKGSKFFESHRELCRKFLEKLLEKPRTEVCAKIFKAVTTERLHLMIILNSPGGLADNIPMVQRLIDSVRARNGDISVLGISNIDSAAAQIFIHAPLQDRFLAPDSNFMIHLPIRIQTLGHVRLTIQQQYHQAVDVDLYESSFEEFCEERTTGMQWKWKEIKEKLLAQANLKGRRALKRIFAMREKEPILESDRRIDLGTEKMIRYGLASQQVHNEREWFEKRVPKRFHSEKSEICTLLSREVQMSRMNHLMNSICGRV